MVSFGAVAAVAGVRVAAAGSRAGTALATKSCLASIIRMPRGASPKAKLARSWDRQQTATRRGCPCDFRIALGPSTWLQQATSAVAKTVRVFVQGNEGVEKIKFIDHSFLSNRSEHYASSSSSSDEDDELE